MFFFLSFPPILYLLRCLRAVAGSSGTGQNGSIMPTRAVAFIILKSVSSLGLALQCPQGRKVAQTSVAFFDTF